MSYETIYIGPPYQINVASSDGTAIESGDIIVRLRAKSTKKYFTATEDDDQEEAPEGTLNFTFDTSDMIQGPYILEVYNADSGVIIGIRDVIEPYADAKVCSMTSGYSPGEVQVVNS